MNNWQVHKLEEICKVVAGGTPKTSEGEYWNGDIPWITPKDLSGYKSKYIDKGARSITGLGLSNSSAKLSPSNSVILSSRAPIGYTVISKMNSSTNQGMKSLIPKSKTITEFLYYLIKYNVPKMIHLASGSTFKEISTSSVRNLIVNIPPIHEQKAIAEILSSLDDKIEINNKINKNLEEIAQVLYKQWFVDFEFPNEEGEPYKSSGGEMIESELGLIPKGWVIKGLNSLFKFIKGKKPKVINEKKYDGYMEYLTLDVLKGKTKLYADTEKIIIVDKLDVTMVMDGASSGSIYYGKTGILSSTLSILQIIDERFDSSFLYSVLKNIESAIKDKQTGSAIPHTDKNFVYSVIIAYDEKYKNQLAEFIKNIREEVINLTNENEKLKNTRDTLLPKLMSGEIRVPTKE